MSALILKSGNALNASVKSIEFAAYKQRVVADGGHIVNEQAVSDVLQFITANNIPVASIKSATSANWGVKLNGTTPLKLYNLFDSAGDLICSTTDKVKHVVSGDKAYLHFTESSASVLETSGTFSGMESAIINVVARFGEGTTVSAQDAGTLGSLYTKTTSTSSADLLMQRPFTTTTERNGQTNPSNYVEKIYGYTATGNSTLPLIDGGFTNWITSASALIDSKLKNFRAGALNTSVTITTPHTVKDSLYFSVGSRRSSKSVGAFSRDYYFWGQIAESWLVINSTDDVAKALSLRASQKYIG